MEQTLPSHPLKITSCNFKEVFTCCLVYLRKEKQTCDWRAICTPVEKRISKPVSRTSMYRFPMWCLCLCSARSLCSSLTNLTRASPFLLPWALRQSAAPPLQDLNKERDKTPWPTQMKHYKCRGKFLATNLAIFRPLKNLAMSWSDDCHGNPLARITALSSTSSILLLQAQKEWVKETHLPVASTTHYLLCLSPVLQGQAAVPALSAGWQCQGSKGQVPPPSKTIIMFLLREYLLC